MGDAHLECRSKSIRAKHTARLRIHQSHRQRNYVFWKYEMLKNLVSKGPRLIKAGYDKSRKRIDYSWYFHTKTTEELGLIHKISYKNKIKIVPKDLLKIINPLGLAVWYMDDGSNNGSNITLNTHSFSVNEQELIKNLLMAKFGIKTTLTKDRDKFKIAIGVQEYDKFLTIVKPYIIPSMNYKINYKILSPRKDLFDKIKQVAII